MGPGPGRRAALDALPSPAAGSHLALPSRGAAELSAAAAASCLIPPASPRSSHRPLRPIQPHPLSAALRPGGVGLRAGPAPNWAADGRAPPTKRGGAVGRGRGIEGWSRERKGETD